ncbi:N-acetylglucosamine-6-phosphate deacetylase [Erysipelothrix inopinata]|uniref:N-acetylglucosamine-6-phosphate deacetylase n=1 Tax=Erysipelothrix inopinata TaxID=225084 RepID=A0A7G9S1B3_9FIRM|nr:N-acetylglucosamine-6-phosphate deacetylase [Erysipelothrix inopinata]QNN61638.1 N-acetylglucosamine-6-phosphate deacetylase [Erysipelothrix inopinata]
MYLYSKNIYFPNQIKREGYLKIEEGVITGFVTNIGSESFEDYENYLIIPGFIDQHLHGWGTGSFGNDKTHHGLLEMKKHLPSVGVTSFLATSGAEPIEDLIQGIKTSCEIMETQKDDGASLLGVHLEGPFVSPKQKGMMREEFFRDPSVSLMETFVETQTVPNAIKLMTMAPELPGSKEVIKFCKANGIQINIGHSHATFEEIANLKEYGLGGVTHMFSGMRGFHHRELGVAGTALFFDDLYCEFAKQTGMTVKPEAFQIAYRLKGPDRIIMTTDNTAMAQLTQERYHYIRKQTFIPDGDWFVIRNDDGSEQRYDRTDYEQVKHLELSYIESIQNLIKNVHPSVHDVIKMTSENCAKYLNVYDRKGSIEVGKDADLLIIDEDFNIHATYCMGKKY